MKAIAIVCLMLFKPLLASEDQGLAELYQDISSTLHAEPDVLAPVLNQVQAMRSALKLPESILEELDAWLPKLKHPEDLLSDEQKKNLLYSPNLQHFQPINTAIDQFKKFIDYHQTVGAYARMLQQKAKETLGRQKEWSKFISDIIQNINENTLTHQDILKIHEKAKSFHSKFKQIESIPPLDPEKETYKKLIDSAGKIKNAFLNRGHLLWEVIRNVAIFYGLADKYEEMTSGDFLDANNPIIQLFTRKPEERLSLKKSLLSIPTARSILTRQLHDVFKQPKSWESDMQDCQATTLLLVNAQRIVDPLTQVVSYYERFQPTYLDNLDNRYDFLTSKGDLAIPGHPLARIPRSFAIKACSLLSNGPFCVNLPKCDQQTILSYISFMGGLAFETRRELFPSQVGAESMQYVLETLFGIPSRPVAFIACDRIPEYVLRNPRLQPDWKEYTKHILIVPGDWGQEETTRFMTVRKERTQGTLKDVIHEVAAGEGTFEQSLDPESVGELILFSLIFNANLWPEHLGLIEKGKKFGLERIGFDSCLQPLFQLRDDQKHKFIGRNILYLHPFMASKIPDKVREKFLSQDIHLILSDALLRLTTLQNHYNGLIKQYNLSQLDDLDQDLKANITKARALGLVLGARTEKIQEIIWRSNRVQEYLRNPECTYNFIQEQIDLQAFQCYQQILENAQKKTETTSIFFGKVISTIIEDLRTDYEKAKYREEDFPYTSEDLDSFELAAALCYRKANEYLQEGHKLFEEKRCIEKKIKAIESRIKDIKGVIDNPESDIDNALSQKRKGHKEELKDYRKEAGEIAKALEDLSKKLSLQSLFEEFEEQIDPQTQDFFKKKYIWAEKNHIFQASVLLNAWCSIFNVEEPTIYEDLKHSPLSFGDVPTLTSDLPPQFAQLVVPNHSIKLMVQDLVSLANLDGKPPHIQIKIIDNLLQIIPDPVDYHESWMDLLSLCRKQFLGIPPTVQTFFHQHGLAPDEEKAVLQIAQMQNFESYEQCIKDVKTQLSSALPSSKKWTIQLYRQLWKGPLKIDTKDAPFFEGILNVLLFPTYNSETKDDYLSSCREKWIELYRSSQPLSDEMRIALLSHTLPLLQLKWIQALKKLAPDAQFNPKLMKTLYENASELQKLLSTRLSVTFPDIMSVLLPDISSSIKQELEKQKRSVIIPKSPDAKSHESDHLISAEPSWDSDRAATEWLSFFDPAEYGTQILACMLDLASQFKIDVSKINRTYWRNPQILIDLARLKDPTRFIQFAADLRMGFPYGEGINLVKSGRRYEISGTRGNADILCDLIPLFPKTTGLNISDNGIRSLKPLLPSLCTLTRLTSLNLSDNPIHNLSYLVHLPQLESLFLRNTCIPEIFLDYLCSLISSDRKVPPLPNLTCYVNEHTTEHNITREKMLSSTELATLHVNLAEYVIQGNNLKPDDIDTMICILNRLAKHWDQTLGLYSIGLGWDHLFDLLNGYDPGELALKLLFAFKFQFPVGTTPFKLSFMNNLPTKEATSLTGLAISNVPVHVDLLSSLTQFGNLTKLYLWGTQLTTLKNIPPLTELKLLDLKDNQISSLRSLHTNSDGIKFPKLQVFVLKNNRLTSETNAYLNFLLELPLIGIDLSNNLLIELPKLGTISTLRRLNISVNDIPLVSLQGYKNTQSHTYLPQRNRY